MERSFLARWPTEICVEFSRGQLCRPNNMRRGWDDDQRESLESRNGAQEEILAEEVSVQSGLGGKGREDPDARAASQSHAGRRAPEPASPLQAPKGSSARIVSWADEDSSAPRQSPRPQDSPAAAATPSANTPRAIESHEIRFND
jgi:hypothetical protein